MVNGVKEYVYRWHCKKVTIANLYASKTGKCYWNKITLKNHPRDKGRIFKEQCSNIYCGNIYT